MSEHAQLSGFNGDVIVKDNLDGTWTLQRAISYTAKDGKRFWFIPAGFRTDFGSVPGILDWLPGLHSSGSDMDAPYILHDWFYSQHRSGKSNMSRSDADEVALLESAESVGVGYIRRHIIWFGVRVGGFLAWSKK